MWYTTATTHHAQHILLPSIPPFAALLTHLLFSKYQFISIDDDNSGEVRTQSSSIYLRSNLDVANYYISLNTNVRSSTSM